MTKDSRPACGEEGVGPFAGLYCVLNAGHPRPPGHVYAPAGTDRIDHLDAMLLTAHEAWKREAELRNEQASRVAVLEAVADDALALLDQHISDEQRRELGVRIIERLTQIGKPSCP